MTIAQSEETRGRSPAGIHRVLVTGGAGYIGSHFVKALGEAWDAEITVLDNLSTGRREAVWLGRLVEMDLADRAGVERLLHQGKFDAIVHFAASIVVPESVADPLKYYDNNTAGTIGLVRAALREGVRHFVFSSTAAVYGTPRRLPVGETAPLLPINPYGWSKRMNEQVLRDAAAADPRFTCAVLRYFNVAGANSGGRLGQSGPQSTHLIKVAAEAACGKRKRVDIFGTDYPTPDGTCVRDYIHVDDLADAHLLALDRLAGGTPFLTLNCGYGRGHSVREVIAAMKEVSGVDFPVNESARRPGDPAVLVAGNRQIRRALGWRPRYDDLRFICRTAYEWERRLPR